MSRADEPEVSPEEARALLAKLLTEAGAEVDPSQEPLEEPADAVERARRPLETQPRPAAPMPSVGRAPRKKP